MLPNITLQQIDMCDMIWVVMFSKSGALIDFYFVA